MKRKTLIDTGLKMGQKTTVKPVSSNQPQSTVSQQLEATLKELYQCKAKYKAFFDYTMNGIAIYEGINDGKDFIFKDFNPAAEQIESLNKKEILSKNVKDVFPGVVEMGLHDVFRRVYLTGKAETFPVVQYKDNRIYGWRENHVFKLPTGEIASVYRDMTEYILSQNNLQYLEKAIDCCLEGVTITDPQQPDEPVIYVNEGFEKISGYCKSEVIGRNMRFLQGPATDPDALERLYGAAEEGRPVTVEILTYRKDGSCFWNRVAVSPIYDDNGVLTHFIAVHTDITERKKSDDILQKNNTRLNVMATELEKINSRLVAFQEIATLKDANIKTLCDYILEQIINISNSKFGFFGLMDDAETELIVHAWSGKAMEACRVVVDSAHFPIRDAGIWAEAVRKREPLIINDYTLPHEAKKGLPEGHVMFSSMMCVPVFYNEKIVALAACANKQDGYTKEDIGNITTFCDNVWVIIQKKYSEEEVQKKHQQLRTLTSKLSSAKEQEAKRIAEEIHDSIIQPLIFLDVKVKSLDKMAERVELAQDVSQIRYVIRELIEKSRSITVDLCDPVLCEFGLEQAIGDYISTEIEGKYNVRTDFNYNIQEKQLNQDISFFLYKTIKELLVNVLKHAEANNVVVSIEQKKKEIVACVEDDGCGFGNDVDSKEDKISSGFGLFNIQEKVDYWGGNMSIDSSVDLGSQVTVTIPIVTAINQGDNNFEAVNR